MKYWMFQNNQVNGPYDPDDLSQIAGFSAESLVCPEGRKGTNMGDWQRAGMAPELSICLIKASQLASSSRVTATATLYGGLPPEPTLKDLAALGSLQEKFTLLENTVSNLQDGLRQKDTELLSLHKELESKIIMEGKLQVQVGQLEEKLGAVSKVSDETVAAEKDVEHSVKDVENSVRHVESSVRDVESTIKGVESSVKDVESTIKAVESTVERQRETIDELMKELENLKKGRPGQAAEPFNISPAPKASDLSVPSQASPFSVPAPADSPFGPPSPAAASPFGAPSPAAASPFGAPSPAAASPFAAPTHTPSPFGAPPSGPSDFGMIDLTAAPSPAPKPAPSAFDLGGSSLPPAAAALPTAGILAGTAPQPFVDAAPAPEKPKAGKKGLFAMLAVLVMGAGAASFYLGLIPGSKKARSASEAPLPMPATPPAEIVPEAPSPAALLEAAKQEAIGMVRAWPIADTMKTVGQVLESPAAAPGGLTPWMAEKLPKGDDVFQVNFYAPKAPGVKNQATYEFEVHLADRQVTPLSADAAALLQPKPPAPAPKAPRKVKVRAKENPPIQSSGALDSPLDTSLESPEPVRAPTEPVAAPAPRKRARKAAATEERAKEERSMDELLTPGGDAKAESLDDLATDGSEAAEAAPEPKAKAGKKKAEKPASDADLLDDLLKP